MSELKIKPINFNNLSETCRETDIKTAIQKLQNHLLETQHTDGSFWYTLEANDSINAEYVFLLFFLGVNDEKTLNLLCAGMIENQNKDGSWSLYYGGDGDLSATVEVYLALKICGFENSVSALKAKKFILSHGGITQVRVFTRIHLALLGLLPFKYLPSMPVQIIQLKKPFSIYEFSSWARACIVPLLILLEKQMTVPVPFNLDELYATSSQWRLAATSDNLFAWDKVFIYLDRAIKILMNSPIKPLKNASLKKCEVYVREHLPHTHDIFPAMFYGVLALKAMGYGLEDEDVQSGLAGLKSFQLTSRPKQLTSYPYGPGALSSLVAHNDSPEILYQQCCISPVWDSAWAGVALLESGLPPQNENLQKLARFFIKTQITNVYGDWAFKVKNVKPGGWAFEFKNDYFPDIDDSLEVLRFLHGVALPYKELTATITRGVDWLLAMQSSNGGFAAFDKDNTLAVLNELPFSDHGACLDPPTADITARMVGFLVSSVDLTSSHPVIKKALRFIASEQKTDGSFGGRWGVNYVYGTWCVVENLYLLKNPPHEVILDRSVDFLKSVQNDDGGFGESCASYKAQKYVPLAESTASQTAWGLLALTAASQKPEAHRAAKFLLQNLKTDGTYTEPHFTGTGFPGHFYIRYHGYARYFPLLALARYYKKFY